MSNQTNPYILDLSQGTVQQAEGQAPAGPDPPAGFTINPAQQAALQWVPGHALTLPEAPVAYGPQALMGYGDPLQQQVPNPALPMYHDPNAPGPFYMPQQGSPAYQFAPDGSLYNQAMFPAQMPAMYAPDQMGPQMIPTPTQFLTPDGTTYMMPGSPYTLPYGAPAYQMVPAPIQVQVMMPAGANTQTVRVRQEPRTRRTRLGEPSTAEAAGTSGTAAAGSAQEGANQRPPGAAPLVPSLAFNTGAAMKAIRMGHNHANTSSAYLGVTWYRASKRWQARLCSDNKKYHLGYFATEIEAARAYDRAVIEHKGPNAPRNFADSYPGPHTDTHTDANTPTRGGGVILGPIQQIREAIANSPAGVLREPLPLPTTTTTTNRDIVAAITNGTNADPDTQTLTHADHDTAAVAEVPTSNTNNPDNNDNTTNNNHDATNSNGNEGHMRGTSDPNLRHRLSVMSTDTHVTTRRSHPTAAAMALGALAALPGPHGGDMHAEPAAGTAVARGDTRTHELAAAAAGAASGGAMGGDNMAVGGGGVSHQPSAELLNAVNLVRQALNSGAAWPGLQTLLAAPGQAAVADGPGGGAIEGGGEDNAAGRKRVRESEAPTSDVPTHPPLPSALTNPAILARLLTRASEPQSGPYPPGTEANKRLHTNTDNEVHAPASGTGGSYQMADDASRHGPM